jgi:ketosteroid isomerase-like protein
MDRHRFRELNKIHMMNRITFVLALLCMGVSHVGAQSEELQKEIDDLNRQLDRAVVAKDISKLEKHYGDDFVFTHSDGKVDSKESWIKSVHHAHYVSREHDSTKVEVHDDIAIVTGKLNIERKVKHPENPLFSIHYVRVYAKRNDVWQLICHRSVLDMEL